MKASLSTGYISNTIISSQGAFTKPVLETIVTSEDIADFDIYINPKRMAVSNRPFNTKVELVTGGVVYKFGIDLGFTNKI